jgi:hypothetical protein
VLIAVIFVIRLALLVDELERKSRRNQETLLNWVESKQYLQNSSKGVFKGVFKTTFKATFKAALKEEHLESQNKDQRS